MKKTVALFALLALLLFVVPAIPQEKSDKFAVFVVSGDDSAPVAQLLIKKLKDSKPFTPVAKEDPSKAVVIVECMHRAKQSEPFVCMYVLQYNGDAFKTFFGGGLYVSTNADEVAANFLAAMASDIVERWDKTNKDNLKGSLESCIFLTDSKCNVPDPLQEELGAKQLSLGQYLIQRNQQP